MPATFPESLDRLRGALTTQDIQGPVTPEVEIVPGLLFSWDPAAEISLTFSTREQGLFQLDGRVRGQPDWFGLSVPLGPVSLSAGTTLGLVAHWRGPVDTALSVRLRSGPGDGQHDTALGVFDRLDRGAPQVLLHDLDLHDPATAPEGWHSLLLALPCRNFSLTLLDLRGFLHRADDLPPAHGQTLARLARGRASR